MRAFSPFSEIFFLSELSWLMHSIRNYKIIFSGSRNFSVLFGTFSVPVVIFPFLQIFIQIQKEIKII